MRVSPSLGGDDQVQQAALGGLLKAEPYRRSQPMVAIRLGRAGLEQFLNTGKTLGDIAAGQTAGVEGTHGQLGTGLADGLGRDDADRLAGADRLLGGQVHAVALGAHAAVGLAGQNGADHDGGILVLGGIKAASSPWRGFFWTHARVSMSLASSSIHHLGVGDQHLAGGGIHHVAHQDSGRGHGRRTSR